MNRRAALFLLLYLAAILYLSLYPWTFVPNLGPRTLVWVPVETRRAILDAFLNVVFYMPLGAAAFVLLRPRRMDERVGAAAFVGALTFGTFVSFSVEWTQLSIPTRLGNLTDLASNSLGTLLGIVVAFVANSRPVSSRLRALHSPGVLLVGLWVLWQAFTFLPRYAPAMDISHEVVGLLILALLAARRQFRASAIFLLIWLAADELRPFQFQSPPQPFWWLPFESWFAGAPDTYYGTFFRKLFLYTAILWAERRSGMRWIWALLAPGAVLFVGELTQRYLPGRTPETTDLFLLTAGAVLLYLTEPSRWDNKVQS